MKKLYVAVFTFLLCPILFLVAAPRGYSLPLPGPVSESNMLDLTGPAITYAAFSNSSCLSGRSVAADITDIDGVNVTVGNRPRIYYKRSSDANVWNSNSNLTPGWKYVEASNTVSPFNFNIDYSFLFPGGGVAVGNTIQYFIVAEDMAGTPNLSLNNGAFNVAPVSVALTGTAFPISGAINSYNIVTALGTSLTVGLLGNYTSITGTGGLFDAINTNGLSGNTTVNITAAILLETGLFGLNQIKSVGCSVGDYTLTIKPAAGLSAAITGNFNGTLFRILSNNVTIDGSNNGTSGRNLTITNANLSSPSVLLFGSTGTTPIINSTLKNTTIINGINTVNPVVISDAANPGDPGYFNNITIQNNSVQTGYVGIYCVAVPTAGNGSVLVTGNDMNTPGANSIRLVPLYCQGVDGAVITNNNLGNILNTAESNITGIWIAAGSVNCTVSGNNIATIAGTIGAARGIVISSNIASSNIVITDNNITGLSTSSTGTPSGILIIANTGNVQVLKNNISNIRNSNSSFSGCNGIQLSSSLAASAISVNNNFIYDVAGYGKAGGNLTDNGYGIAVTAGAGYNIDFNTINLDSDQTVPGTTAAINFTSGVNLAGTINLRNNIFANNQSVLSGVATRYAIYCGASSAAFGTINNNNYYSAGTNIGYIGGINRANLTALQTGFGGNLNSISFQPNFISSTNLHLQPAGNCRLDGYGLPVAGIGTDIDNQARSATAPDIGADEFTGTFVPTTMATNSACDSKPVLPAGYSYMDGTCNLIARVLPSGADPVSGQIKACVTIDATQQYFNGEPYVQRHYDIEPVAANETSTSATITLFFNNADFVNYNTLNPLWPALPTLAAGGNSDPNRANLKVTQFHGVANTSPSSPGNYPGVRVLISPNPSDIFWNGSFWEISFNVVGFSGFYVHTNSHNAALPIVVNYLNGYKRSNGHLLSWKITCNKTPHAIITVERSSNTTDFGGLYSITADAARCEQPFEHLDQNPAKGINYYRLKVADADGNITYSTTVALLNAVKGLEVISLSPNPVAGDIVTVTFTSTLSQKVELQITDIAGRLISRIAVPLVAGYNSLPLFVGSLAKGMYTLSAVFDSEKTKPIRFIKQ